MTQQTKTQARHGKELILATKEFAIENRAESWFHTLTTLLGMIVFMTAGMLVPYTILKMVFGLLASLFIVRMFIIYHDNQHAAVLHHSKAADLIFKLYGLFILAPTSIWKRSHDHHHVHNSKLSRSGIGAYPTVSKEVFDRLSRKEQFAYLATRHPLTILGGYITLFIYNLNIHSVINSFRNHYDCGLALFIHGLASALIAYFLGWQAYVFAWLTPFVIAHGLGSYMFYIQHNFPGAEFNDNKEWTYHGAALESTSFVKMHPVMHWFTGNIAYHHVHHLNVRIPFYRLPEVMKAIPELQHPKTVDLSIKDMLASFRLKVWDTEKRAMVYARVKPAHKKTLPVTGNVLTK
jgi:acyl-lipid omega-6 desaturase (Delta-12 desaturase)